MTRWRTCQHSRPRHSRPTNGTYRDSVATSPDVNVQRFARFVKRVLGEARDRGMTDTDIEKATGVRASTFHRWQRGEVAPQIAKVNQFCDGLGVPRRPAYLALGITEGRDEPEPEPAIDPEVRRILRLLADPSVSDEDKHAIRAMLRVIGPRARGART
jgi:transcriptional regulator with XRE-family HTH domain